jgi:hypothetical protein
MKTRLTTALLVALTAITGFAAGEPLSRPNPPKVEIRGAPGARVVYYWAFARDARGHSAYSDPVVVSNAPDVLSEQNAVILTPSPMTNATEFGLLTTRIETPRELKVEVGAKGDKTFYYWTQTRNGRTVWSPVAGPVKVEGCAAAPENTITWTPTGAEYYYLYRTETPAVPTGWRGCVLLTAKPAKEGPSWSDKGLSPDSRIISPSGNASEKPEGIGTYLVGTSKGEAIVDQGQALQSLTIYDMNTTDPAYNPFTHQVKGFEPGGDRGAVMLTSRNYTKTPQYSWDLVNALSIHQDNFAGGLNSYPGVPGIHHETAKNTYNGIDIHQFNYTPGQHSPYLTFMYNYGMGDNVLFHAALEQVGQNRTAGDEGSEFFSLHMTRRLAVDHAKLAADAKTGDIFLRVDGSLGTIAGARGIVNLTQKYAAGQAHVEGGAVAVGTNTAWASDMEGRWISFDADTTKKGIRQWYLVEKYISPTRLQLWAQTYWGKYNYKGNARLDGAYLICPYTEMADGDANSYSQGLRVTPLACDWRKGDDLEAIAGPQTTFRLGWWETGGEFLPQDHVAGLGIAYNGDKPTSEGALITYNWGIALEVHKANVGLALMEGTKVGLQAYRDTPVLISCIRDDPWRFELAQETNGFTIGQADGPRWLGLGVRGLTLYGKTTITGNDRTRGLSTFSGDGQATRFTITFSDVYTAKPFVVASANLPIGMGVTETTRGSFVVTFASPPPAGQDNIEITWMAQE